MLEEKLTKVGSVPKNKGVAYYKKQADKYWSTYIRLRDSDVTGYGECITCGAKKYYKDAQCGHFIKRSVSLLRYDETNCNLQCVGCNMFKYGEQYAYSLALDKKHGDGTARELYDKRFSTHKFTTQELLSIIDYAKENIAIYEQNLRSPANA